LSWERPLPRLQSGRVRVVVFFERFRTAIKQSPCDE